MAGSSRCIARPQSHHHFLLRLFASLVIAGILNSSQAVETGDWISVDRGFEQDEHVNNTLLPFNAWSTTASHHAPQSTHLSTRTIRAVASSHTTNAYEVSGPKTERYEPYNPVLKIMTSPLRDSDLEPSIDYYNEEALIREYSFNPMHILKKLIDSANAENTAPTQFLEEIHHMISLQNRSKTDDEKFKGQEVDPKLFQSSFCVTGSLEGMCDGWENELEHLERKYNVTSECTGPESVTANRLALMFPHFLNLGQKPFAVPVEVAISDNYKSYRVPSYFKRHEFGGLIPRWALSDSARRVIIGTHLFALYHDEENDMIPFRIKCMMLRWRMEKSTLTEDRKIRLLRNNDIITSDEQLLKTSLKSVYDIIPRDFKNKIDWNLFGISPLPM